MPRSHSADLPDLRSLEEKQRELEARIQSMRAEPEKILREAEEQAALIPPPDDLVDRRRQRDFEDTVSRRQIRNERRTQGRSLLLLLLLLGAAVALGSWVLKLFVA